ncbi:MAG TPA: outer membrane beta-barrel protein [Xanthobacteraceae bacterium]|nr:outer membrane beta-barrel protein [Xanthobacteraceae bacterium]
MLDDTGRFVGAKGMKGRPMRRGFCCALLVFGLAVLARTSPACAQDLPFLRGSDTVGPATFTRWSGFYFGGQVGFGNMRADFSNATAAGVAYALRNTSLESDFSPSSWPVLGTAALSAPSFGGFVGYSTQWQDLILGVEANFNQANFSTLNAPNGVIKRSTGADSSGNAWVLNLTAVGSVTDVDFATLRFRAGYILGNFLPYAFVGPAFGLGSVSVGVSGAGEQFTSGSIATCNATFPCYPFAFANGITHNDAVFYGFTVGGGADIALTANLFLRAEFEWDQFDLPPGVLTNIVTGRVGAGLKF